MGKSFSIRSRLLIILLAVSIVSSIILIIVGYTTGKNAIKNTVLNQLKSIRTVKAYQVDNYFKELNSILSVYAKDKMMHEASREFGEAFNRITSTKMASDCNQKLSIYYDEFATKVAHNMNIKDNPEMYYPNTAEACYLQYHYIIKNPNPSGQKYLMTKSNTDESSYATIHEKYHKIFSDIVQKFGLYDLFLINLETGDIIYSVFKETDFATNLYSGPYRESNLADLARILRKSGDIDQAQMVDFSRYRPSIGAPAAFIGISLSDNILENTSLVFQVPISGIDKIMTGNYNWQSDGMGSTGETYLVGDDYFFRSNSRFFLMDSLNFQKTMLKKGYSQDELDNMQNVKTNILGLQSKSESVKSALSGNKGVLLTDDYRGVPVITAFEPLQLFGLKWAIVSKKDQAEAFKPIQDFKYKVFIALAGIVLLISFLSMWLSERFIKPIMELSEGAKRISNGETDFKVNVRAGDELGNLASVFNQMTENLTLQKKSLKKQNQENERLLLNFLPEGLAKRFKNGETNIVEHHSSVTVLFARINGIDQATKGMNPDASYTFMNNLFQKIDDLAQRYGIQKIVNRSNEYLAACGLHIQRLDHQKRTIEFAIELRRLIYNYSTSTSSNLFIEIGIHTGQVTGGIIGQEKFEYNVWGDTIANTVNMLRKPFENQIIVSNEIIQRVPELYDFENVNENLYRLVVHPSNEESFNH